MTNYQPEFWFRGDFQPFLDPDVLSDVVDTQERAAKTLHAFDRAKEPYGITIELVEHGWNREVVSLGEFCQAMIETLTAPRQSTGGRACQLRWLAQLHATMRFAKDDLGSRLRLRTTPDLQVQPAGTLLIDVQQPAQAVAESEQVFWEAPVATDLSQHPLAHAGAEYVVVVDLPLPHDMPDRGREFQNGLALIQQLEQILPATAEQRSVLTEFWLNFPTSDVDDEPITRLRIWRSGVMQIATKTRQI